MYGAFERLDLVVGQPDVERGDGFGQVVRLVAPTMGAAMTGLAQNPGQGDLGHA